MTMLPLAEGARVLGIHPKTFHQWLKQAQLPLFSHPTDARLKCVTWEHLEQLACTHARPLQLSALVEPISEDAAEKAPSQERARTLETDLVPISSSLETDLIQKLSRLETTVATLQQQLTDLALQLLQERTQRYEQRLQALEASKEPAPTSWALSLAHPKREPPVPEERGRQAAKKGEPSRLIPLIEYSASGRYVILCPTHGERSFAPESPEWFAWLATLSSFRFVGQQGRLSAYRKKGRLCWMAYRRIHGHIYQWALGKSEQVTLLQLEEMAATLQSHAPSF